MSVFLFSNFCFVIGAIELSILADYYGREIGAYDIQTSRCDLYGQVSIIIIKLSNFPNYERKQETLIVYIVSQTKNYNERVMLIYDGLHYDALAVSS